MKILSYAVLSVVWIGAIQAIPLFDYYQELTKKIPYISFATLPTPVEQCYWLENELGYDAIFIKRDDFTGSGNLYGGNKVRKLEFLLAEAINKEKKKIITYGAAGTNHGLATACYTHELGLACTLMLRKQPNSPIVRQNLLLDLYFGAEILLFANNAERNAATEILLQQDSDTYFIPTGGSVPVGALGYVNAAFELKEQIERGILPKPDYVYLPIGSSGTAAGLLLGFVLAGIDVKIVAVATSPEAVLDGFLEKTKKLFFGNQPIIA